MCFLPNKIKDNVTIDAMFLPWSMQLLKATVQLYSLTVKLVQEKPTQWQENSKFLQDKSTSKTKERA